MRRTSPLIMSRGPGLQEPLPALALPALPTGRCGGDPWPRNEKKRGVHQIDGARRNDRRRQRRPARCSNGSIVRRSERCGSGSIARRSCRPCRPGAIESGPTRRCWRGSTIFSATTTLTRHHPRGGSRVFGFLPREPSRTFALSAQSKQDEQKRPREGRSS